MNQVFRLGHVLSVFESDYLAGSSEKADSQGIEFVDAIDTPGGTKGVKKALPLLRGISDSIARGDSIIYMTIGTNLHYYLGPINTINNPSYPLDVTYDSNKQYTKKNDNVDGYNKNMPPKSVPKMSKPRYPVMDHVIDNQSIPINSQDYFDSTFSDMVLEGRYGNSIRLGARDIHPQLIISNNNLEDFEKIQIGTSTIGMTSIGRIEDNFILNPGYRLSIDKSNEEEDVKVNFGHDNESEKTFNYEYNRKSVFEDYSEKPSSQIIISSDRIIFDSMVEDVTVSSNRNINIGANKNISIVNKGFSVFQSQNIYIGQDAKLRTQPMVLGENLRHLLAKILRLIADSYALGDYNVPQPLTLFPNITQAGSLRQEVEAIMGQFGLGTLVPGGDPPTPDPQYLSNIDEETNVATQPTVTGNATFLSNKHFIEPNQE